MIKKRIVVLVLTVLLVLGFAGCQSKIVENEVKDEKKQEIVTTYPMTIKDSYDREVVIEAEPKTVISIAPNITETIFALNAGDKLVGRTDYCDYPEEVDNIQTIGSLREPNIEKIVELKPDLVIASTHFKKEVLQKLEESGLKVIVLYGPESFDGVYSTIKNIGLVLNKKEQAQKIVTDMKSKVDEVTVKVKDKDKPSVYYVIGFGEYGDYTATKETFIAQMIEMAGGQNAANDSEGWKYSLEKLVEKDPHILVCSKYFDSKAGIQAANGYKDLTAIKEGRLYEMDNNMLDRQGPRLADGLFELAKIVHPDAFK